VRCHRLEEAENEIPGQFESAYKLLDEGDYKGAKSIANTIAKNNLWLDLPKTDEGLKTLFRKIRIKRTEARKTVFGSS
jgi:hypothetical protein